MRRRGLSRFATPAEELLPRPPAALRTLRRPARYQTTSLAPHPRARHESPLPGRPVPLRAVSTSKCGPATGEFPPRAPRVAIHATQGPEAVIQAKRLKGLRVPGAVGARGSAAGPGLCAHVASAAALIWRRQPPASRGGQRRPHQTAELSRTGHRPTEELLAEAAVVIGALLVRYLDIEAQKRARRRSSAGPFCAVLFSP